MDNNLDNNLDSEQFSLESILAEYLEGDFDADGGQSIEEKSRSIMRSALGDTVAEAHAASAEPAGRAEDEPAFGDEPEPAAEDGIPEPETESFGPADEAERYSDTEASPSPKTTHRAARPARKKSLAETLMAPVLSLLASAAAKHAETVRDEHMTAKPVDEGPELPPKKAAKLYAMQLRPLVFRSRAATFVCILLTYITFAFTGFLPLFGALGSSTQTAALVCLVLMLTVMLAGLDVFTAGLMSIVQLRPGAESLAALSCIFSALDAVLVASGRLDFGLPLCAVSAWSICLGIWGERFTCSGMESTFRVLADAKHPPRSITSEPGIVKDARCVLQSDAPADDFIRRSEDADLGEIAHIAAAPYLIIAALVLAALAAFLTQRGAFIHIFSATLAACSTFVSLIAFPMAFAASAKRLHIIGAAIAGYPGCADIGEASRFVVLDRDIFPPSTIQIKRIQINGKDRSSKVIGYTGSLIAASGCALAPVFKKLMQAKACTLSKVENFSCHEGGGIIATINGEEVFVGSSSFMNLMSIHLPVGLTEKAAVFTAINRELAGIFTVEYAPTEPVRRALEILLRDYRFPIFAVRDFNINPMMIRQRFKIVTDDFEFPTFAERYRVSSVGHSEDVPVAAVVTRSGLGAVVECAEAARRLYFASRILAAASFICAALGMAIVMLLCASGAPSAALASRLLLFMLIWIAPVLVISYSLR